MNDSTVSNEVRELRHEIALLRDLIADKPAHSQSLHLRIFAERTNGERKPFLLVLSSSKEHRVRLSAIRTAITLSLLLDLEQRSQGLPGAVNTRESAAEFLLRMNVSQGDMNRLSEQIRVAFYRYAEFWKDELEEVTRSRYDREKERLFFPDEGTRISVELTSTDPLIEDALPKVGQTPMLDRLRRDKFLFVPGGGKGSERFLKEIYASPGPLEVSSAYARLQLITVPQTILRKYCKVPEALERNIIMHDRLANGLLTYSEIIPEDGFEELVNRGPEADFAYFPGMSVQEIVEHLDFVQKLILSKSGYRLIVTRSEIPFYLGRFVAQGFSLSSFFKLPRSGPVSAYSSFAVWGPEVGRMAEATLFDWLLQHPTTTSDPTRILEYLSTIRQRLLEKHAADTL